MLTQDKEDASEAFPLGEHAHIVGDKPGAARYDSVLDDDERDGYANRVLLCPDDHTVIDNDEAGWPIERLHQRKAEHELWVEQTLTTEKTVRDEANDLLYGHAIDRAVQYCRLDIWETWASASLEPHWFLRGDVHEGAYAFRELIWATDWPGRYPELEVALDRLSFELQEAVVSFAARADRHGDGLRVVKRYKHIFQEDPEVYESLKEEFWDWSHAFERRIFEATKAANWAREVWRREVNPMFRVTDGLFYLTLWPDETGRYNHVQAEYTDKEKAELLAHGVRA